MNPCINCTQLYCCKLADKTMSECPVFADPPQEPPTHKQIFLPLTWDALEGCERGGGT